MIGGRGARWTWPGEIVLLGASAASGGAAVWSDRLFNDGRLLLCAVAGAMGCLVLRAFNTSRGRPPIWIRGRILFALEVLLAIALGLFLFGVLAV